MNRGKPILVVTGGSRGIGAAIALLAAQRGYAVCVNYVRNEAAANQVLSQIHAIGGEAIAVQADMASEADIERLFKTVDSELGCLTALVNNAGIVFPHMTLETMTAERINATLTTNVTGAFLCAREAVKRMATRHGGSGGAIVNISSVAAKMGSANSYLDYAASKGALDTFTKGLSKEVADQNIRVNTIRPGYIDTDIHATAGFENRMEMVKDSVPMKRVGQAEEIASAALWLLSDEAAYVTGAFLDVAGGF